MKINVGDKVKTRTWRELDEAFGNGNDKEIDIFGFVHTKNKSASYSIRPHCGKKVTITKKMEFSIGLTGYKIKEDDDENVWLAPMFVINDLSLEDVILTCQVQMKLQS